MSEGGGGSSNIMCVCVCPYLCYGIRMNGIVCCAIGIANNTCAQ